MARGVSCHFPLLLCKSLCLKLLAFCLQYHFFFLVFTSTLFWSNVVCVVRASAAVQRVEYFHAICGGPDTVTSRHQPTGAHLSTCTIPNAIATPSRAWLRAPRLLNPENSLPIAFGGSFLMRLAPGRATIPFSEKSSTICSTCCSASEACARMCTIMRCPTLRILVRCVKVCLCLG